MSYMEDIAIFGAGGFGREIKCLIDKINEKEEKWNFIGFFDDGIPKETDNGYGQVLGGVNELNLWPKELNIVIAIGKGDTIEKIYNKIINPLIIFPNIEYNLWCANRKSLSIGKGNIIARSCAFSCDVIIGDFNVFNGSVVLGHDVKIGNFNTFMPATRISGEVSIGDNNFFGLGSIVIQGLKITNNTRLSPGSVLITKPKSGELYIGNPAKKFKY